MFAFVIAAPALWSAVVVDWSRTVTALRVRCPCYSHMSTERCTDRHSFGSYGRMHERVEASGGSVCAADEVTRNSGEPRMSISLELEHPVPVSARTGLLPVDSESARAAVHHADSEIGFTCSRSRVH